METIVADLIRCLKNGKTAVEREQAVMVYFQAFMQDKMAQALETLDLETIQEARDHGYFVEKKNSRTVQFLFGPVTFQRRRLIKPGCQALYPLDHFLGIQRSQRFSALALGVVAELAAGSVYRTTAKAVRLLTPLSMSHQKVQQLVLQAGKRITDRKEASDTDEALPVLGQRQVPVLYIEGDGLLLKEQRGKHLELHRFQVYEGSQRKGKRVRLKNLRCFSHLTRTQALKETRHYLETTYDLSHTLVISNSDGGSGYEKKVFQQLAAGCERFEYFIDVYHVHRKVKERLRYVSADRRKKLERKVLKALRDYNWKIVCALLDTAEGLGVGEQGATCEQEVQQLRAYLTRNWEALKPLEQRGLGKVERCLGTCESNHRLYSYRMKHQGRSWCKAGAQAMARILDAMKNQVLPEELAVPSPVWELSPAEREAEKRRYREAMVVALRQPQAAYDGTQHGTLVNASSTSSAIGHLTKVLR